MKKAEGFTKEYWDENYSKLSEMDGIFNAKAHARYLKASFDLEYVEVNSIIDFGAGFGHLLKALIMTFKPYKALALEPSTFAFEKLKKKKLKIGDMQMMTIQTSMLEWLTSNKSTAIFDLGVCTSVLQYIDSADLQKIIPLLAKKVRYLYLTVPIDLELAKQKEEYEFADRFALHRSHEFYYNLLRKYFTFVGNRILESKEFCDYKTTPYTELLFRF
jgi:SAM-dependent methyltransferase